MSTRAKLSPEERRLQLQKTEETVLHEVLEYAGRVLQAWAQMKEAERNRDEGRYEDARAELSVALFVLRDKAQQAHDLMEEVDEQAPEK
jgi:hypothetical protein